MTNEIFETEYKNLNQEQRKAVEAIDGPVMVVAGPGTGKTQILALRIANILQKTDIKADGILCLTFTNSAVEAMKTRLTRYIGEAGEQVNVFTFHSFGMKIIGENFKLLRLSEAPKLLEDTDRALFFEQILSEHVWKYLRPRGDSMRYFSDLMSLASILKRERISSGEFNREIREAMEFLESDEGSVALRGENKGGIKKEILKEIESLKRSVEITKFLDIYENTKKEKNLLDYDDVLAYLVKLVEISPEVVSSIRERYLYVLVDEHQDSSRLQNEFLARVWVPLERPDIFVVGDDRQLIYGFSGASIAYFKDFQKKFPSALLITLVDNYRSTQVILDAAHLLLQSVMSDKKLRSQRKETHPLKLVETDAPKGEIMALGLDLQEKIKKGMDPNDCALLLPKNKQIQRAVQILHDLGVPVSTGEVLSFFDQEEAWAFLRVLKIISSEDKVSLALSFLDKISGIDPVEAHTFLACENMREFSLHKISGQPATLFAKSSNVPKWISKLSQWKNDSENQDMKNNLESFVQKIGEELFAPGKGEKKLVTGKEIVDTILDLLGKARKKNPSLTFSEFVSFLDKLAFCGEHIPLISKAPFGVKVLTMHASKGLEFDYVWIAHMDEKSLSGGKRMGFTLPPSIVERIEERDIDAIKRKLYVAITRAKKFCTLSYAKSSEKGIEQELGKVIADLPPKIFAKQKFSAADFSKNKVSPKNKLPALVKLSRSKYRDRYVSVSLLNNFFDCPWQWYFRNLLGLPEPKTETLAFGSMVHAAIDRILKMKNIPEVPEVKKIVAEEVLKSEYGGALDKMRLEREAMDIVIPWVKNRLGEINTNRKTEESVSISGGDFPHLKIYGKIDLIENIGIGEVRVTDFKTGGVRKKSEIEKMDSEGRMSGALRQLAMYSYLLRENPKWKTNVRESRLEFLEAKDSKEAFYDRVITQKEIDLLVKDIKDYDKLIQEGEWINRPCNYNSYGKATVCEYCKMAETYKS